MHPCYSAMFGNGDVLGEHDVILQGILEKKNHNGDVLGEHDVILQGILEKKK